jgi:SAM-dependent methyltransferase
MQQSARDSVQELYRSASQTRSHFGGKSSEAIEYYSDLVDFIRRVCPEEPERGAMRLLDVGCGCGWSSFCLASAGYDVTGIDLNGAEFEAPEHERLVLAEGSAMAIPFGDCSFDVVATYQCLEHIPDPELALQEMTRVCKPGGVIAVVGPNLVSPYLPIKVLVHEFKTGTAIYKRVSSTPRHPYGNTVFEHVNRFFWASGMLLKKLLEPGVRFGMRVPDSVPPFHGDNDSCYLCNPTDIVRYFRSKQFRILQNGKPGRPFPSQLFAGGTWVGVQKHTNH